MGRSVRSAGVSKRVSIFSPLGVRLFHWRTVCVSVNLACMWPIAEIEPMDSSPGQKLLASLVDIAFFVVLGLMGWHGVLKEGAVLMLLGLYAQGRFNVAMQKQQTVQMATVTGGPPMGPGPGGGLRTGTSGRYTSVVESVVETPPRTEETLIPGGAPTRPQVPRPKGPDPRSLRGILSLVAEYGRRPAYVLLGLALLTVLFTGGRLP
jgi:hypothetical protein